MLEIITIAGIVVVVTVMAMKALGSDHRAQDGGCACGRSCCNCNHKNLWEIYPGRDIEK
jgi:hypothetical protein